MVYLILHPREIEAIERDSARGQNLTILEGIRLNMNRLNGELTLTPRLLSTVRACHRQWRLGGEKAFQAVIDAAQRDGY